MCSIFEPDRNVLRKKERDRRNQETPLSEWQLDNSYPLFSEPYKTSKGDELSSRVQNTLGSYDEMKDLLTDCSNQTHLIGIPKAEVLPAAADTRVEQIPKDLGAQRHPSMCSTPATSAAVLSGQRSKKAAMSSQKADINSPVENRQKTSKNRHILLPSQSSEVNLGSQHNITNIPKRYATSSTFSSSSMARPLESDRSPLAETIDRHQQCSELICNMEVGLQAQERPVLPTKNTNSRRCVKNFPASIASKPSLIQQKPTAYVRPMDGQDQAPDESPNLKSSTETNLNQVIPSCKPDSAETEGKLEKYSVPPEEKETGPGDNSCVEEILREMTHCWPPPVSAIQTPANVEQHKHPFVNKDTQNGSSVNVSERRGDVVSNDPVSSASNISMLEDDLKLSSDEDDESQQAAERSALGVQSDRALVQQQSNSGASNKGSSSSSSSSDSDSSSSTSDSETDSSSSGSGRSKPPHCSSPEPEPPATNKWQLDKWLNKVKPQKSPVLNQDGVNGLESRQYCSQLKDRQQGCEKVPLLRCSPPSETQIPAKEEQRPRTANKTPGKKSGKQNPQVAAAADENSLLKAPVCRKPLRRTERTSAGDAGIQHQAQDLSQIILADTPCELSKSRLTCSNRSLCLKELRSASVSCEKRRTRRISKPAPKSKEFIETESSSLSPSSDLGIDSEQENSQLAKTAAIPAGTDQQLKESGNSGVNRLNNCNTGVGPANSRAISDPSKDLDEPFYTLVPFGRNELLPLSKDTDEIRSLWVQIDLGLLARIPYPLSYETLEMSTKPTEGAFPQMRNGADLPAEKCFPKCKRKRKCGNEEDPADQKRNQVERHCSPQMSAYANGVPATICETHISNSAVHMNTEATTLGSSVLPLHDPPKHKYCSEGNCASMKTDCSTLRPALASFSKNHQYEDRPHSLPVEICSRTNHRSSENGSDNKHLPQREVQLPHANGHSHCRRPKLIFDDTPRRADYFMQEAKRMKHKADAMMEKFGKALNYTEAALSFIECGNALEHGPVECKSPYTMYSETVELIRYAMRLKSRSGSSATPQEKQLAALCYRCLALLYWRMFRLKRHHAVKYSKALIDYFKSSAKAAKAPSSWGSSGKSTGTPSPLSPSPSPIGSSGSQDTVSSTRAPSPTSIISIPQRVHQMAANHVSITNSILHSYDYWEIADNLTKENIDFFNDLDSLMGPVTLHSSMEHLVQYTRQGLHWVRSTALLT
ncbi:hypothetical protein NDU88_006592 [Pleurodeles waltl]|uniref:AF4/FMR2 C-terminal homology domain-containing protein n=1 Tax=Pleurodeles waltl TaxID=8319 RepID=A0AAV7NQM9_PLEWA|nr:hypothetical protein NDU88_006592 [Pleurodeles waltl]